MMASGITPTIPGSSSAVLKKCDSCSKVDANLLKCSICKITYYCNPTCQRNRWNIHRVTCKKPDESKQEFDAQHKATGEFLKFQLSQSTDPNHKALLEKVSRMSAIEKEMDELIEKNPAREYYKEISYDRKSETQQEKLFHNFIQKHNITPDVHSDNRIRALKEELVKLASALSPSRKPLIEGIRAFSRVQYETLQRDENTGSQKQEIRAKHQEWMRMLKLLEKNEDVEQILGDASLGVPEHQLFTALQQAWLQLSHDEAASRREAWSKIAPFYPKLILTFKAITALTPLRQAPSRP